MSAGSLAYCRGNRHTDALRRQRIPNVRQGAAMRAELLLFDIGNTSTKIGLADAERVLTT